MSKIYVKLKDGASIFNDASGRQSVTGKLPVLVTRTIKINQAVAGGVLIRLSDEEANRLLGIAKTKADEAAAAKEGDDELTTANEELTVLNESLQASIEVYTAKVGELEAELKASKQLFTTEKGKNTRLTTKVTKLERELAAVKEQKK